MATPPSARSANDRHPDPHHHDLGYVEERAGPLGGDVLVIFNESNLDEYVAIDSEHAYPDPYP